MADPYLTARPAPPPERRKQLRPANEHERRMVQRGQDAGFRIGRYRGTVLERIHPAGECPYPEGGKPRALWLGGKGVGIQGGLEERVQVRRSYAAAVAALDGPQRNCWGGTW